VGGPGPRLSRAERAGPGGQVQLAVLAALRLHAVPRGAVVVVGVSGGPDSLALLAATLHVGTGMGLSVHAVCVDHGWHRRSTPVAVRAARACSRLGADDVRVVRVRPARTAAGGWVGGPEEAARTARLAALTGAAQRDGAALVLLGHTLDDQAEQVLLGLARGSGARSLGAMAPRRGLLVRPLLGLRRDVVRAACPELADLALPWHDPSNADPAYLRARVRHELLPVLGDVLGDAAVTALARSADLLREDDAALRAWAERETALLLEVDGAGAPHAADTREPVEVDVPVAPLLALPVAVRSRVLRLLAARAGARALTAAHTRALDDLLTRRRGQGPTALPGSVTGRRTAGEDGCGRLRIARDSPPREDSHGRP